MKILFWIYILLGYIMLVTLIFYGAASFLMYFFKISALKAVIITGIMSILYTAGMFFLGDKII